MSNALKQPVCERAASIACIEDPILLAEELCLPCARYQLSARSIAVQESPGFSTQLEVEKAKIEYGLCLAANEQPEKGKGYIMAANQFLEAAASDAGLYATLRFKAATLSNYVPALIDRANREVPSAQHVNQINEATGSMLARLTRVFDWSPEKVMNKATGLLPAYLLSRPTPGTNPSLLPYPAMTRENVLPASISIFDSPYAYRSYADGKLAKLVMDTRIRSSKVALSVQSVLKPVMQASGVKDLYGLMTVAGLEATGKATDHDLMTLDFASSSLTTALYAREFAQLKPADLPSNDGQ